MSLPGIALYLALALVLGLIALALSRYTTLLPPSDSPYYLTCYAEEILESSLPLKFIKMISSLDFSSKTSIFSKGF
jgi:hypothetical protein